MAIFSNKTLLEGFQFGCYLFGFFEVDIKFLGVTPGTEFRVSRVELTFGLILKFSPVKNHAHFAVFQLAMVFFVIVQRVYFYTARPKYSVEMLYHVGKLQPLHFEFFRRGDKYFDNLHGS